MKDLSGVLSPNSIPVELEDFDETSPSTSLRPIDDNNASILYTGSQRTVSKRVTKKFRNEIVASVNKNNNYNLNHLNLTYDNNNNNKGKFEIPLPFGFSMDLDFLRVFEAEHALSEETLRRLDEFRRRRRMQRQTLEKLMGLRRKHQAEMVNINNNKNNKTLYITTGIKKLNQPATAANNLHSSPEVFKEAFRAAVKDFESCLEEREKKTAKFDTFPRCKEITTDDPGGDTDSSVSSVESNRALMKVRRQMAESLVKLKEYERKVEAVPALQVKLAVLKEERRMLMLKLKQKELLLAKDGAKNDMFVDYGDTETELEDFIDQQQQQRHQVAKKSFVGRFQDSLGGNDRARSVSPYARGGTYFNADEKSPQRKRSASLSYGDSDSSDNYYSEIGSSYNHKEQEQQHQQVTKKSLLGRFQDSLGFDDSVRSVSPYTRGGTYFNPDEKAPQRKRSSSCGYYNSDSSDNYYSEIGSSHNHKEQQHRDRSEVNLFTASKGDKFSINAGGKSPQRKRSSSCGQSDVGYSGYSKNNSAAALFNYSSKMLMTKYGPCYNLSAGGEQPQQAQHHRSEVNLFTAADEKNVRDASINTKIESQSISKNTPVMPVNGTAATPQPKRSSSCTNFQNDSLEEAFYSQESENNMHDNNSSSGKRQEQNQRWEVNLSAASKPKSLQDTLTEPDMNEKKIRDASINTKIDSQSISTNTPSPPLNGISATPQRKQSSSCTKFQSDSMEEAYYSEQTETKIRNSNSSAGERQEQKHLLEVNLSAASKHFRDASIGAEIETNSVSTNTPTTPQKAHKNTNTEEDAAEVIECLVETDLKMDEIFSREEMLLAVEAAIKQTESEILECPLLQKAMEVVEDETRNGPRSPRPGSLYEVSTQVDYGENLRPFVISVGLQCKLDNDNDDDNRRGEKTAQVKSVGVGECKVIEEPLEPAMFRDIGVCTEKWVEIIKASKQTDTDDFNFKFNPPPVLESPSTNKEICDLTFFERASPERVVLEKRSSLRGTPVNSPLPPQRKASKTAVKTVATMTENRVEKEERTPVKTKTVGTITAVLPPLEQENSKCEKCENVTPVAKTGANIRPPSPDTPWVSKIPRPVQLQLPHAISTENMSKGSKIASPPLGQRSKSTLTPSSVKPRPQNPVLQRLKSTDAIEMKRSPSSSLQRLKSTESVDSVTHEMKRSKSNLTPSSIGRSVVPRTARTPPPHPLTPTRSRGPSSRSQSPSMIPKPSPGATTPKKDPANKADFVTGSRSPSTERKGSLIPQRVATPPVLRKMYPKGNESVFII